MNCCSVIDAEDVFAVSHWVLVGRGQVKRSHQTGRETETECSQENRKSMFFFLLFLLSIAKTTVTSNKSKQPERIHDSV